MAAKSNDEYSMQKDTLGDPEIEHAIKEIDLAKKERDLLKEDILPPEHFWESNLPVKKSMLSKIIEILMKPFDAIDIGTLPKGGGLLYLETHACIDRLNEAFTPLGWSFEPAHVHERNTGAKYSTAVYGVLTIHTDFGDIKKGAWGGQDMSGTMADDLKGASSDSLKKAATLLGVYNYGYRKNKGDATADQRALAMELSKLYTQLGWDGDRFREWSGGLLRHTITSPKDISPTQGSFLKVQLEELVKAKDANI